MSYRSRFSRIASLSISTATMTFGMVFFAAPDAAAETIVTVCPSGVSTCTANGKTCNKTGGAGLQAAIDEATSDTAIELCTGTYRNLTSTKTVDQLDHNLCGSHTYTTSFLVNGKTDLRIRAAGSLSADSVVLLGDHEHTLTLLGSTRVRITGISLVSQGGTKSNGIGDSSLNVQNSSGLLEKSIVTYNHTSSNKAQWDAAVKQTALQTNDQEGIQLAGPDTYFEIYDNIIAENLHNGIIAIDGADAFVAKNLIYHNGHYGHFAATKSGQGLNVFHDRGEEQYCASLTPAKPYYNGSHGLKAWNNVVESNSGHGIILRGWFPKVGVQLGTKSLLRADGKLTATDETNWGTDFTAQLAHNRVRNNGLAGIRLGHWWSYKQNNTTHGAILWVKNDAQFQLQYNDVAYNNGNERRPADIHGPNGTLWPQGPLEGAGLQLDDIAIWVDSSARVKVIDNNWAENGAALGLPQKSYPSHVSTRVDYYASNTELNPATNQSTLDARGIGAYFASSRPWVVFDSSAHPSVQGGSYSTKMSALTTRLGSLTRQRHWIEVAPETKIWCEEQNSNCPNYTLCQNLGYCVSSRQSTTPPDP